MITTARGYVNELNSLKNPEDELRQMMQMAMAIEQRLRLKVADTVPDPTWAEDLDSAFVNANNLVNRLHDLLNREVA